MPALSRGTLARRWPAVLALALLALAPLGTGASPAVRSQPNDAAAAIDAAQAVLESRMASVGPAFLPMVQQERRNLDAARDLLAGLARGVDFRAAVALAERGTRWQAEAMGVPWPEVALPHHASPSQALAALAARHGVVPSADQAAGLARLDALPEPVRSALTGVVDAFVAFEQANQDAFGHADAQRLHDLHRALLQGVSAPAAGRLREAGVDLAPVFPARSALLAASAALRDALAAHPLAASDDPAVAVPPVVSIDLGTTSNTYPAAGPFALLVDGGGDDVYLNNAGGSNLDSDGDCTNLETIPAAALLDLGSGADQYGSVATTCSNGANGGGFLGSGFLADEGGADAYTASAASEFGLNGGGAAGTGFLLDAGRGADTYAGGGGGVNGGALDGAGFLLNMGDGAFTANFLGTNGGGNGGVGFLLNGGNGTYAAGDFGTNGGGALGGVGFLLDAGKGASSYQGGLGGTNGGGSSNGVGFLLDTGDGATTYTAMHWGTNGGGDAGGVGVLLSAGKGATTYTAEGSGTNGGGHMGVGLLLDMAGDDAYVADGCGSNGGASTCVGASPAAGLLLDAAGIDRFQDTAGTCQDTATTPTACTVVPKGLVGAQVDGDCRSLLLDPVCALLGL
jgi:hypothetical protein